MLAGLGKGGLGGFGAASVAVYSQTTDGNVTKAMALCARHLQQPVDLHEGSTGFLRTNVADLRCWRRDTAAMAAGMCSSPTPAISWRCCCTGST